MAKKLIIIRVISRHKTLKIMAEVLADLERFILHQVDMK